MVRGKGDGEGLSFMAGDPRREATRAGAAHTIISKSPFLPVQLGCGTELTVRHFGGSLTRKAGLAAT